MSATPWGPPIDVLPLFAKEEQALIGLIGALTAEEWQRPTACAGWTVHDVAAHILGGKLGRLSGGRDEHRVEFPRHGESLGRFIDRINEEWVAACRRLSFEVVCGMLIDHMGQTTDYWSREELDEPGEPVSWAGPDPAPRWLDAARDYSEFWVHHQQIREATGYPVIDMAEFGTTIADTFVRALPYTLRDVDARVGKQVGYTVTGDGGGKWTAVRQADGWMLDRGAPTSRTPLASITTDDDTFWRLCTRNVEVADVADKIETSGDENVCATVLEMVSIIISEPPEPTVRGGLRSV